MASNSDHARLCPSPEWAEHIQQEILPEVTNGVELGQDMLEIGPAALLTRLQTIGFQRITVTVDWSVKFVATKAPRE